MLASSSLARYIAVTSDIFLRRMDLKPDTILVKPENPELLERDVKE